MTRSSPCKCYAGYACGYAMLLHLRVLLMNSARSLRNPCPGLIIRKDNPYRSLSVSFDQV